MHISDVQFQPSSIFGDYATLRLNLFHYKELFEKYELKYKLISELLKNETEIKKVLIAICFESLNSDDKQEMLYLLEKTMFKEV